MNMSFAEKLSDAKTLIQEVMNVTQSSIGSKWLEEAIELIGRSEAYIEEWEQA